MSDPDEGSADGSERTKECGTAFGLPALELGTGRGLEPAGSPAGTNPAASPGESAKVIVI